MICYKGMKAFAAGFINGNNGKNDREEISAETTPQQKEKIIPEILSS